MRRLPLLFTAALALGASAARADGAALRANLLEPKAVRLDGVPKEWPALASLGHAVKGKVKRADLEAKGAIAYDADKLYVAADVTDDVLRPGADRVELVIGFPGGATAEIALYPGDPGKTPGSAKAKDGAAIAGARVVEAPRDGGWSLEAAIPWASIPEAKLVRVGLRGALFVHDADAGSAVDAIVGTASSAAYGSLPPINTETEQSLAEGLLHDKAIRGAPRFNLLADVAGDPLKERVLVFDRYLVVLGPGFRKGTEYYWGDLGVDPAQGMLPSCEVRDVTGDGQAEIVLRKRMGTPTKFREVLEILRLGTGDVPVPIFRHEVGIATADGSIANEVSFGTDGGKPSIKITPGKATKFDAESYHEPTETSFEPVLLPWGPVASQSYRFDGKQIARVGEDRQAAAPAPAPRQEPVALPKPPPGPSASELLEKVYDLYKHDRGASGRPRFDLAVDVAGDKQAERVLLHDRDLVIFGKGWKGGTGYTFLTLAQFASAADILDVTARDVTGDGKAEIVVKGAFHASGGLGGGGTVDREVIMIYQVAGDALHRIFSVETARAMGKKRVEGAIRFGSGEIEIAPGKAVEWTEKTYPFGQDTAAVGGVEPLLLPWGSARPVRYRWASGGFSR